MAIEHINEFDTLNAGREKINKALDDANAVLREATDKDIISAPEIILARDGATTLGERLDSEKAEVTAQLAEKADKGNVSVGDINKNLGKFDQTYMTDELLQQMAGNTPIHAVPAKGSVVTETLAPKSTTLDKMTLATQGSNLFDPDSYVSGWGVLTGSEDIPVRYSGLNDAVSYRVAVTRGVYTIKKLTESDRFRVIGIETPPPYYSVIPADVVYMLDDSLDEVEIKVESDRINLIVYVSSTNEQPELLITRMSIDEIYVNDTIVTKKKSTKNIYHGNLSPGTLYGQTITMEYRSDELIPNAKVCIIEIKPNETYTITPYGGDRHRYAVFNTQPVLNQSVANLEVNKEDGNTNPVTFTNTAEGRYLIVYLSSTGEEVPCQVEKGNQSTAYEPYHYIDKRLLPMEKKDTSIGVKKYTMIGNPGFYISPMPETVVSASTMASEIFAICDDLVTTNPRYVSKEVLGQDSGGRDIPCYTFENPLPRLTDYNTTHTVKTWGKHYKPVILLISGTHGDEKGTVQGMVEIMKQLCTSNSEEIKFLRNNAVFKVIPILNVSGFDANTRNNINNVNLNRDYEDMSQIEARIVADWVKANKNEAIALYDFHNTVNHTSFWSPPEDEITKNMFLVMKEELEKEWIKQDSTLDGYDYLTSFTNFASVGTTSTFAYNQGLITSTVESCRHSDGLKGINTLTFNALGIKSGIDLLGNTLILTLKYIA